MSPILHQLIQKATTCVDRKQGLEVHGVRIMPPFIQFKHAFEGRTYRQNLTIQNVGKSKVVVKITKPTSLAFSIKEVKGHTLSPGLSLSKEVSYVYMHANVPYCLLPLYIDNKRIDYEIFAQESSPEISFEPRQLDFGLVDANFASGLRIITIRNDGSKTSRFFIDTVSPVGHKYMADPNKGNVLPKSSVKVHIKIASSMPGRICDNLWLKCDKPYSIPVTAEVINPCFEPIHDLIMASFSVVEFPPTYIGVISSKTMYIRNYSANAAMFCIKRDLDATAGDTTTTQNLKESPELAEDSNYFDICPKDGVWDSKEVKAFHLFFNPAKLPPNKPLKHFYFGIYNVHRVKCRYLRESIYEEKIFGSEQEFHVARPARSVKAISDRVKMAHASVLFGSTTSSIPEETKPSQKYQCMKLYVHAVAEKPSVTVIPDEIKILNLAEGQQEVRVLNFQNNSKNLPIFISYQKVTYVDVDPSTFSIDAAKSIEISVSITPRRMGHYATMLQFDLKYYDESLTKKELKVIGKASVLLDVDIKCSKKAQLPKIETSTRLNRTKDVERLSQNKIVKRSVVVIQNATAKRIKCDFAFPRDSPWKFPKIKTASKDSLRSTQSVGSDRGLTIFGEKIKIEAETYHSSYLKRTAKQLQLVAETKRASDDYDLTDVRKLLYENFHLPPALKKKSVKQMCSEFIPLSPTELNNVIIDPIFVYTERVAVHSEYTFELTIKNSNTFPIRVYIRPEKSNITFPKGNRHMILGNDAASLPITYVSTTSGYYTASLDIIVNECSVFVVNIMADVSPIFLNLNTDAIQFTHENTHFVEIFNPLNADTTFRWSIRCQNFSINPIEGVIKGNSQIACQVTYLPTEEGPPEVEAELLAFEIVTQVMRLSIQSTDNGLRFVPQELMFNDIPLNVPIVKEVLLRNESTQARVYGLMESEFLKYADVYPSEGIVYGNSHALIWVTLKINTCVTFSTKLKINIKGVGTLDLGIKGNVAYPDIIIRPPLLKFQQIPASTVRTSRITVENRSKASASIKFDMSMYSEYKITETKCYWEIDAINEVMLQANSSKHLYFHFMPNAMITDEFCLPFIVNDIIGPSDAVTKNISLLDANIPSCKKIATPLFYSVPKIRIYTTAHKLKFSHLRIFLTYKIPPLPCKYEYNLKISNPQRTEENFCFRTDTLTHPFYITHARGKEVTFYEKSIVCSLSSEEEVVLNIAFKPDVIGTFNMSLPIFLMSDMIASPHNTLFVEGVFKLPEIVTANAVTYHKPGALLVCNTGTIRLSLNDHLEICKLGVSQEIRGWTIEFIEETSEDPRRRTVLMNFTFTTDQIGVGAAHHCITCTCGASSIVTIVGYRENCFLTNYAQVHTFMGNEEYNFQLKNTGSECSVRRKVSMVSMLEDAPPLKQVYELDSFFTEYPFFPEQDTELKEFLEPVVEALEDWVSTQGFFGICFYSIPIEFAYVAFDSPTVIPPFIQLLLNLTENKLEGYFDLRHPGIDDVEKVRYLYELYEKALAFLQSIGALFVYVRPELLLGYTPYMVFLENFEHDEQDGFNVTITNRQEFYRLSKQYWLDVLLQTYKVLVLKRLFFLESGIYKPPRRSTAHERYSNAIKKIATNKHLLSNRELLLLNWFEFHYNDVRNRCWLDNPYLEEREITFFGENMTDGFVYAAVVITYCPFLVTHFRDMCKEPLQPEEILHNNIKVLQSWRILNFNIKVRAEDIMEPNSLKTLMIMTYLCQMLPDMHPYETLYFTAGLSQHSRKTLVVKNVNDFPIAYKAILYGDDSECFNVNEFYVIPPQSKCKIVIDYWAKFIRRTYCTLILSGECLGYHYATSNVVTLVGNPDITFVTMEKEIQGELHSVVERTVEVKSPYQSPALYKIQFTNQQPTDTDGVNSLSYELPSIRVCRFLPVVNWMNVDDDGGGFIDAYITALTTTVRPIWVFFRNSEVGDFAIKVITSINIESPVREVLRVSVPKTIEQVANGQFQTVNLQMPGRNKCVWDMVAQMFTKSGEEEDFWRTYVHSTVGIHVLQKILLKHVRVFKYPFCEPMRYKMLVAKNCGVKFPKYVDFDRECSFNIIDIPIQIPRNSGVPKTIDLELVSLDGFRQRYYTIVFINDSD